MFTLPPPPLPLLRRSAATHSCAGWPAAPARGGKGRDRDRGAGIEEKGNGYGLVLVVGVTVRIGAWIGEVGVGDLMLCHDGIRVQNQK